MGECFKFGRGTFSIYKDNFADNTWAKIISACQSGKVPSTWKVGDQKTMTINGTDYPIDIIGINHDVYSDGGGTAPLTFQMHDCYGPQYVMDIGGTNTENWTGSDMYLTHLPAIFSTMPIEVQNSVRFVDKRTAKKSSGGGMEISQNKLFLLSEIEIFGSVKNSEDYYGNEGTQYAYYANGGVTARVKLRDGAVVAWVERSPRYSHSTYYCAVDTSGEQSVLHCTTAANVSFAFCF